MWILDLSPIRRGLRVSGVGVWNAKSLHLCPADSYAIGEANYSARDSTCIFPALSRYEFQAERFRELRVPGARRSPSAPKIHATLYVTDVLAAVLPDVRIQELPARRTKG